MNKTPFHSLDLVFQLSVAIAWSPDCIDIRCYDYQRLTQIADLAIVMAYDERSRIFGECVAWANSAVNQTSTGMLLEGNTRYAVQCQLHLSN